jgi:hypothetical protein
MELSAIVQSLEKFLVSNISYQLCKMDKQEKKIFFLVPGKSIFWNSHGGSIFAQQLCMALSEIINVQEVTYEEVHEQIPYLNDVLSTATDKAIWVMYWGPHIDKLQRLLWGRNVLLFAQSAQCYEFEISPQTVVISISRFVQSWFASNFPHNPVYLLYPRLSIADYDPEGDRPIDILHHSRKSALYMKESTLLSELSRRFNVHEVKGFIKREELLCLFTQSKIYLYSLDIQRLGVEGLGMQPLEALLHGCMVFSELGAGLSDFMNFGPTIRQIGVRSLEYDIDSLTRVLEQWSPVEPQASLNFLTDKTRYHQELSSIWEEILRFFNFQVAVELDYSSLMKDLEKERYKRQHPGFFRRVMNKIERELMRNHGSK